MALQRLALLSGAWLAIFALTASDAGAAQSLGLSAAFAPDYAGARATMQFGLTISTPGRAVPPPGTRIELDYPAGVGIANSGLGFAVCSARVLTARGPAGCPINSRIGFGTALVAVPFGPEVVRERADITIFSAPVRDGKLQMLFLVTGETPISAEIVLPGRVEPAGFPFGGAIDTQLPKVPTVPEGPNVSLVQISATIGPSHLRYVEYAGGRQVYYHPEGLRLPNRCPRGGFPFTVRMSFEDGTQASAHTAAPCRAGQRSAGTRSERPR